MNRSPRIALAGAAIALLLVVGSFPELSDAVSRIVAVSPRSRPRPLRLAK